MNFLGVFFLGGGRGEGLKLHDLDIFSSASPLIFPIFRFLGNFNCLYSLSRVLQRFSLTLIGRRITNIPGILWAFYGELSSIYFSGVSL
jgi:hypothetical protein